MGERLESMNAAPAMFRAGISTKFTTRRGANFHDTTLAAASAAKQRAERRADKQADALDKQQKKIESEMRKIEDIAQKLHQRQVREAKRLRGRLHFAATRIQGAFRRSRERWRGTQAAAAARIQCRWRCVTARACVAERRAERRASALNAAAATITRSVRVRASRLVREQMVIEREYSATLIQSVARVAAAKLRVADLQESRRRHCAAVRIQSTMKGFVTRLIYLDVLYVICRIQAVVRGFLVRRRLQWVAAIDIDGVYRLQALARGFLTRRQLRRCGWRCGSRRVDDTQDLDEQDEHSGSDERSIGGSGHMEMRRTRRGSEGGELRRRAKRAKAKPGAKPSPQVEVTAKRSYWLPAGASFSKRLPVLAAKRAVVAVDSDDSDDDSGDNGFPGSGILNHRPGQRGARTPKKRNQKNRPPRLTPVSPSPAAAAAVGDSRSSEAKVSPRFPTDAESELLHAHQALEDRHRREEELKQKLLSRRQFEKRKLELEQRLKREQESEESERKLMEREEKLARLLLKVQHRRSKEVKIKKQTGEQQREERERIAMAREERQARLLAKLAVRQALIQKHTVSATSGTAAHASAAATSSLAPRKKGGRSRTELHSTAGAAKSGVSDPQDDDADMSFLDIDFKIPASMQRGKAVTKSGGGKKPKRRLNKAVRSADSGGDKNTETAHHASKRNNQEEITSERRGCHRSTEPAANDFEVDYGNEFEEVIDEVELSRLIC